MTRLVASPRARMGAALHRTIQRVEASGPLAQAADRVRARVEPALDGELLHGTWLGHSAHPFFTDFPEGAWLAASFLDLFGPEGSEASSQRLLAFGLLTALPTAATGFADWSKTEGPERQSGLVHAFSSSLAMVLYAASYAARRRNKHFAGVAIGVAGGIVATLDGWVGGHLSLARGVGVAQNAFDRLPAEWTPTSLDASKVLGGRPYEGVAGTIEIVVVRKGDEILALSGKCSFDGAALSRGTLWDDVIVCPECRSGFRVGDGSVNHGPAGVPQAQLQTRVHEGQVHVRAADVPGP